MEVFYLQNLILLQIDPFSNSLLMDQRSGGQERQSLKFGNILLWFMKYGESFIQAAANCMNLTPGIEVDNSDDDSLASIICNVISAIELFMLLYTYVYM